MALYIMRCSQCGHVFEARHPMDFEGPVNCPNCDSDLTTKVPTAPGIVFDWKSLGSDDGPTATAKTRFRPSAVPRSVASMA